MSETSPSWRLGALDVGSLTVRGAVADSSAPGRLRVVQRWQEITALGQDLAHTGYLAPAAMSRTFAAATAIVREWQRMGVSRAQAVATQAVRQAHNGAAFLTALQEGLGIPVSLLTPDQEAALTLEGVLTILDPEVLKNQAVLVADVGGGSSEFILAVPDRDTKVASLPVGVLSLSQSHPLGDPPQPQALAALRDGLRDKLTAFIKEHFPVLPSPPPLLVGTAGAVTTLAAMAMQMTTYDPDRINNYILTKRKLKELAATLAALPAAERARLPGLNAARAGVMVAGAYMILAILEVFGQDQLMVSDAALLEGLLSRLSKDQSL